LKDIGRTAVVEETTAASDRKRVLVVNDDQAILEVFQALLEDEGYEVILDTLRTGNLNAQYTRLVDERPDVVVLDLVVLGEQVGWQFLQLVKMQPQTTRVPVIVCTAAVELVKELGAHLASMRVEVVLKPFEIDHLYAAIVRALNSADSDPWAEPPPRSPD